MTTPRYHGGAVSGAARMGERDSLDAPSTLRSGRRSLADGAADSLTYHIESAPAQTLWAEQIRLQAAAQRTARAAVANGTLIRPARCDECRRQCKPAGHHDDYRKPLEIRWLCPR